MARPIEKGLSYFPHDTDAANDDKLQALQALYGNDGYAFYFKLLERIYRSENAELNISDAETIQILCRNFLLISPERFYEILGTALKWGCFDKEAYDTCKVLTSSGIKKRAAVVFEKRQEMRQHYEKSRCKGVSDAETTPETGISAGFRFTRESKVNKRISGSSNYYPDNHNGNPGSKEGTGDERDFCQVSDAKNSQLTNEEIASFTTAYSRNIAEITPFVAGQLKDACENYSFGDLMFAVRTAAEANVRNWKYVAGVLEKRRTGSFQLSANSSQPVGRGRYPDRTRITPSPNLSHQGRGMTRNDDPDKYIKGRYGHMVQR